MFYGILDTLGGFCDLGFRGCGFSVLRCFGWFCARGLWSELINGCLGFWVWLWGELLFLG